MEENNHWQNKVRSFETETIEQMEDQLNKFFENKFIIASPVQYVNGKWIGRVYYKIPPVIEKEDNSATYNFFKDRVNSKDKPTDKQINYLKALGYKGDLNKLTMTDANKIIKQLKEKK